MLLNLTILPGDGIGPEVTEQAVLVLQTVADAFSHQLQLQSKNIGGAALSVVDDPLPADTIEACLSSSAVLLGAVGSPAFDHYPQHLRPEAGLLRLRRELGAYANLRPAICFPALEDCSPLRAELVSGADIMIVRELLGGLYFGEPRSITGAPGARVATNTMTYGEPAIERIARVAFDLAMKRRQESSLRRQSQCPRVFPPVARNRHPLRQRLSGSATLPHVCGFRRHVAGAASKRFRRNTHRKHVRRHSLRPGRWSSRLARAAGLSQYRRLGRRVRTCPRLSARHRRKGNRESSRRDSFRRRCCCAILFNSTRKPPASRTLSARC